MRRQLRKTLLPLTVAVLVWGALPAQARPIDVIRDCNADGRLDRTYPPSDYQGALDQLPSDIDEYTDCRSVIRRAQLAAAGGKGGGKTGILGLVDTTTPPSAQELRKIEQAIGSAGPVDVGGRTVEPGSGAAPFLAASLGTDLPPLVAAVLVGLAAAMLWAALFSFRRRWPEAWRVGVGRAGGPLRQIGTRVQRGISRLRR